MSKGNSTGAWAVTLARAGYGVALLAAPQVLIRLTGDPVTGQAPGDGPGPAGGPAGWRGCSAHGISCRRG